MRIIDVPKAPLEELAELFGDDGLHALRAELHAAHTDLDRRTVWNINSTERGGGVAEMLYAIIGYCRSLELDVRWAVIGGEPGFFEVTKRLHNHMHGNPGDGGGFGHEERAIYERTVLPEAADCLEAIQPGDFVICHDPQTAGLVPKLREHGARVVWRCHIGHDDPNDYSRGAWRFLEPYLEHAERIVFTRESYKPELVDRDRCVFIHPAIDPLSFKNRPLPPQSVFSILDAAGIIADGFEPAAEIDRPAIVHREGGPIDPATPIVTQVSRWDRLKDPVGVMRGFVEHLDDTDAALVLAGPDVEGVADDPEGRACLEEVREVWTSLSPKARSRVHIACLPMHDVGVNALMVNALQRHAAVVVQKSLQEGFGLTVSEAMWKARPVVATAVGGIRDQIEHEQSGLLVDDPTHLESYAGAVRRALEDADFAMRLGLAARERVRSRFLITSTLRRYAELFLTLADRNAIGG